MTNAPLSLELGVEILVALLVTKEEVKEGDRHGKSIASRIPVKGEEAVDELCRQFVSLGLYYDVGERPLPSHWYITLNDTPGTEKCKLDNPQFQPRYTPLLLTHICSCLDFYFDQITSV